MIRGSMALVNLTTLPKGDNIEARIDFKVAKSSDDEAQLHLLFGPFGSLIKIKDPVRFNTTLTGWAAAFNYSDGLDAIAEVSDDYAAQLQEGDFAVTPTFGLDYERLKQKGLESKIEEFNRKAVDIVAKSVRDSGKNLRIAASIAPVGDCYQPYSTAAKLQFPIKLDASFNGIFDIDAAANYHSRQINALLSVKDPSTQRPYVTTLLFETNAVVEQAIAAAIAGEKSRTPYIISFVVDKEGYLIGTTDVNGNPVGSRGKVTLAQAIKEVSRYTGSGLLTYGINCSSYQGAKKALAELKKQSAADKNLQDKVGILYLNASDDDPRVHEKHDADGHIHNHDNIEPREFARRIVELGREYSIKTLSVCCGGDASYLAAIRNAYAKPATSAPLIIPEAKVPVGAL